MCIHNQQQQFIPAIPHFILIFLDMPLLTRVHLNHKNPKPLIITTMKKILLLACFLSALSSFAQTAITVPPEVLTDDSTYWSITTLSTVNYVNTTPGAYYNTVKSGGGMIVKFKFKKNNRYEFQLYLQANTYNIENETWTNVEGTVEFTKDDKGQNIFITKAEKGTYRIIRNGQTTTRPITQEELKNQHSSRYLWEKTMLKDDPNNVYLLAVDRKKHPRVEVHNPKTIDSSLVSKFQIPVP